MAQKKKKKSNSQQQFLSPKNYILTRVRSLPVGSCYLNRNWEEIHMADIIVTRKHVNGNITAGIYLVDLLALGVKDTHFVFNEPESEFLDNILGTFPENYLEKSSYDLIHNIIYGAVAFAEDHGFKTHKDFNLTSHILQEDNDEIELIDITFGIDGKPSFLRKISPDNNDMAEDEEYMEDLPVYYSYSDEDWREYFDSEGKLDEEDLPDIMSALFEHLYDKKYSGYILPDGLPEFSDFQITTEPDDRYCRDEEEVKAIRDIFPRIIHANSNKARKLEITVRKLLAANPENPIFYNFLANLVLIQGKEKEYQKVVEYLHRLFPRYIFGKLMLANIFLDEKNAVKVTSLFDGNFNLLKIYPERENFHITEFIFFHATMVRYFAMTDDLPMVRYHFDLLMECDHVYGEKAEVFDMEIVKKAEMEYNMMKTGICLDYIKGFEFSKNQH